MPDHEGEPLGEFADYYCIPLRRGHAFVAVRPATPRQRHELPVVPLTRLSSIQREEAHQYMLGRGLYRSRIVRQQRRERGRGYG